MEPSEYGVMAEFEERYWWYRGLRRRVEDALHRVLAGRPSPAILDAGCGTGGGLAGIRAVLPSSLAVGLDRSVEALARSVRRMTGPLVHASVNRLPFADASFDAVVCLDVLCSDGVDEAEAVREMRRVLRPDGWLVLNVPAFRSLRGEHDRAVHIRRRYRRREVCRLLTGHGFRISSAVYWNALLAPVVFAVRLCSRAPVPRATPPRSDLRPLPEPVNRVLEHVLAVDELVGRHVRLPFGTSVFAVARK